MLFALSIFSPVKTFTFSEKPFPKTDDVSFACQELASLFDKYDGEWAVKKSSRACDKHKNK